LAKKSFPLNRSPNGRWQALLRIAQSTRTASFMPLGWLAGHELVAFPVGSLGRLGSDTYLRMFCEIALSRFAGITCCEQRTVAVGVHAQRVEDLTGLAPSARSTAAW
jgi:hypothetical protein